MRVQFICKKNEMYGFVSYTRRSSGLYNSTRFIVEGLRKRGVHAEIIEVTDNNDIDREVTRFKPDICVIEALWVVPEKFDVLQKLHPKIDWHIHMHSHMPFLAIEGIAMEWINAYAERDIGIIANSPESYEALQCVFPGGYDRLVYLPNVYITKPMSPTHHKRNSLHVGCFGAIRPLKNQLLQALAAIKFSEEIGKHLYFYINASRVETNGDPVLKNLRALFDNHPRASLVEKHWYEPEDFIQILNSTIDIGMQVSLTETFNVVTADYVTAAIPIVVSKEVKWASCWNRAVDDSITSIVQIMRRVYKNRSLIRLNQYLLKSHSERAQNEWFDFIHSLGSR